MTARERCVGAHGVRRKFVLAFGKKSTHAFFRTIQSRLDSHTKMQGDVKKRPVTKARPRPRRCVSLAARDRGPSTRALRSSPTRWGARRARRCALAIGTTRTRRVTGRDRHRRWWSPWSRRPRAGGVMSWVRRDARHAAPRRRRRWSRPRPRLPAASPSRRRRGWRSRAPAPRAPRPRGPRR